MRWLTLRGQRSRYSFRTGAFMSRLHTINSQIWVNDTSTAGESHMYGQYAAPYWFVKALRESRHYTTSETEADVVYVNDYCLMMSITAGMHSSGFKDGYDPRSALRLGYDAILRSSRYQETNGLDYVFFSPHALTGISGFQDLACGVFGRSLHIVAEATQRYLCSQTEARSSFLVVPYASPHYVEDNTPWPAKDILAHFHGTCHTDENGGSYGKRMRWHIVQGLQKAAHKGVSATCKSDRPEVPHETLMAELKRSVFCLIIPGDTMSSSRLTEVMLSGCIPTFVGPPWHAVPWASEISYPEISVIFEMHSLRQLGDGLPVLSEPSPDTAPTSVFDHHWWISPTEIEASAIKVDSPEDILQVLQDMPDFKIESLRKKGAAVRSYFRYRHTDPAEALHGPGTASDFIIQHICRRAHLASVEDTL